MQSYAGYIKMNISASDKVFITPGFRYSQIILNSKFDQLGTELGEPEDVRDGLGSLAELDEVGGVEDGPHSISQPQHF